MNPATEQSIHVTRAEIEASRPEYHDSQWVIERGVDNPRRGRVVAMYWNSVFKEHRMQLVIYDGIGARSDGARTTYGSPCDIELDARCELWALTEDPTQLVEVNYPYAEADYVPEATIAANCWRFRTYLPEAYIPAFHWFLDRQTAKASPEQLYTELARAFICGARANGDNPVKAEFQSGVRYAHPQHPEHQIIKGSGVIWSLFAGTPDQTWEFRNCEEGAAWAVLDDSTIWDRIKGGLQPVGRSQRAEAAIETGRD